MAAMVDLTIAGRTYQVACREGEEENLRTAARLVDGKSREALAGLGTLSEARQFLFASLLLADQLIDRKDGDSPSSEGQSPPTPPEPSAPDPALVERAQAHAKRHEKHPTQLEREGESA
jgi:cell division protein ZapA